MAKKRFSEGLDDLFSDSKAGIGEMFGGATSAASTAPERRHGHKNFMSDLDHLLQEALEESLANQEAAHTDDAAPVSNKSKSAARRSASDTVPHGLDALIRQTIDIQELVTDEASGKKRLTVAVDKTKVEKLKTIARLENAYLKDLLVELIDEFIQDYTKQKGLDI